MCNKSSLCNSVEFAAAGFALKKKYQKLSFPKSLLFCFGHPENH